MLLWIGFAVLTAAVVAFLMLPLQRDESHPVDAAAADLAVYRDQLAEIEAERARGVVAADELEGARTEVARRILRRAEGAGAVTAASDAQKARTQKLVYSIAVLIPVASIAGYLLIGAPGLPGRPFAARETTPVEQASVADLIGRVEARLREHPEDGRGWDVLAPVYLRLERYADAAHAYAQASRLLGETPERLIGFGEASVLANNGVVSEDVRHMAERVRALAPDRAEPRMWLGLAKEQDGDLAGAIAAFKELAQSAPADVSWQKPLRERIALLTKRLAGGPAENAAQAAPKDGARAPEPGAGAAGGPSSEDVAAASEMSPEQRDQFISGMVDRLAARLKEDGSDLAGWLKLMRAYKVLGRDGDAKGALSDARQRFAGDQKSLAEIDEVARSLGLGS